MTLQEEMVNTLTFEMKKGLADYDKLISENPQ